MANEEYTLQHTAVEVDNAVGKALSIEANPTLVGTEDNLTGLQVGNTKYKVDSGISQADADARYLKLSGGTMAGHIDMSEYVIKTNPGKNIIVDNENLYPIVRNSNGLDNGFGNIFTTTTLYSSNTNLKHNKNGTSYDILDTSNGLALTGGTMTGNLKLNNNAAKIVDNANLRVIEANNSSLYIGDTTSDVAVFTGNWGVRHIRNNASYVMLDTFNTSANPTLSGTETALTSLKLNGTNYAIAGGTQVTFVDWS